MRGSKANASQDCDWRTPHRVELLKLEIALTQPGESGDAARATRRQQKEDRQQFVVATPVWTPAQFVINEPADDGLLVAPWFAKHLRPSADMAIEIGVEHIRETISRVTSVTASSLSQANDMPRSRLGVNASCADPVFATASSDQAPSVLKPQRAKSPGCSAAPSLPIPILSLTSERIGNAIAVLNPILIKAYRVDSLGKKAAAARDR